MENRQEFSRFIPQTDLFSNRYEGYVELFVHGSHAFGRVRGHGRVWMVKSISAEEFPTTAQRTRLQKEFEIGLTLNHPGIVRMVDFADIPGAGPSIVMEMVNGKTLDRYMAEDKPDRKSLRRIMDAIIDTVSYIHSKGVVHLDLKPENILVTGHSYPVCIIDFGLSDSINFAILKQSGGTPGYASPEQFDNDYTAAASADVWALGRIINEFKPSGIPRSIVRKCLHEDAFARFPTAGKLKDAIAKSRKRRKWTVCLSIAASILIAGCATATIFLKPAQDTAEVTGSATVSDTISLHVDTIGAGIVIKEPSPNVKTTEAPEAYSEFEARHDALVAELNADATRLLDSMERVFEGGLVEPRERAPQLTAAFSEFIRQANIRMYDFKTACPSGLLNSKPPEWFTVYSPPLDGQHRRYTDMMRQLVADAGS